MKAPLAARRGRPAGSYTQAQRLLLLYDQLRGSPAPVPLSAVAERFGVTERTVRRDRAALEGLSLGWRVQHLLIDGVPHLWVIPAGSPRATRSAR